ncbi:hypothetical protein Q4E93_18505 [Flavitalea sp. BT771]|uniref:hypothetical protein n=1 Tax=Flavitalea sp. BT771 TaxID=3063329 RepID=UPI0026E2CD4F|nr:hypothetical protein [Flavitalea sp. BT771]MDO6432604.1 hypothetical protein [Flavitalea sp. BT771]MDV6222120.1 hypothetical protein [Flavitalea sp. BT771]
MLHQVIRRAYYLNKHLEAPLLNEREEYLEYLAGRGLYRETLKIIAEYLLRIVEFLHLEKERLVSIDDIERAASAWARSKHHHPMKKTFSKSGAKKFVVLSIDWLKRINRLGELPEDRIPLFNRLFERRHTRKRLTSAPLLQERLLYLQYWDNLKARDGTLRRMAQYQLLIMDLLRCHTIRKISIHEIEKAAERWAKNEKVRRRDNTYSRYSKRRFIYDAVSWFKMLDCLTAEPEPLIPFQDCRDKYLDYMVQEQGLAEETVYGRSCLLKDFLANINERVQTFAAILPGTIDDVLIKKHDRDGLSRRSVQSYASVVRSS